MGLIRVTTVAEGVRLGLWKIEETEAGLLAGYPFIAPSIVDGITSESRRREILAVRALLFSMTDDPSLAITHNIVGAPVISNGHISISHTRGFAAVILSKGREVAVDIEYVSDRVTRITDKFMRADENRHGVERLLVSWSAKETVYKLRSRQALEYFDMRLHDFDVELEGVVTVDNLKGGGSLPVCYCLTDDYVLTYSFL